jgi:hypothetical protein
VNWNFSKVKCAVSICREMDRVLRSGSGESEIEYSESLVPHAKGINI